MSSGAPTAPNGPSVVCQRRFQTTGTEQLLDMCNSLVSSPPQNHPELTRFSDRQRIILLLPNSIPLRFEFAMSALFAAVNSITALIRAGTSATQSDSLALSFPRCRLSRGCDSYPRYAQQSLIMHCFTRCMQHGNKAREISSMWTMGRQGCRF